MANNNKIRLKNCLSFSVSSTQHNRCDLAFNSRVDCKEIYRVEEIMEQQKDRRRWIVIDKRSIVEMIEFSAISISKS